MERKPEDIVNDIDATRDQLVENLDEIAERLQPEEIARRTFTKAEATAKKTASQVKAYYVDEVSGEIRQDRAIKSGAIAFGLLFLRKLLK
jgi:hypothetical protein